MKKLLIIGLIIVTILILFSGWSIFIAVPRHDMQTINEQMGISEKPPFFTKPFRYYKKHFEQRLKVGMPKDEIEKIVKGNTGKVFARDRKLLTYYYRISTSILSGVLPGKDFYIYIYFDENDNVEHIHCDNF